MTQPKKQAKKSRKTAGADKLENDSQAEKNSIIAVGIIFLLIVVVVVVFMTYTPGAGSECEKLTLQEKFDKTIEGEEGECYYKYNGYSFVKHDGLWVFRIKRADSVNRWNMALHYGPKDVENVSVEGEVREFLDLTDNDYGFLYLTFDPEESNLNYVALSTAELVANWAGPLKIKHILSCTSDSDPACDELTIMSCEEAVQPTVYLKEDPEMKISRDGFCLTVQGNQQNLLRAANKLIYMWYGII